MAHCPRLKAKIYMELLTKHGNTEYFYDTNFVYAREGESVHKLAIFDKHYYKLRYMKGAIILEIDGLRMNLVKDFKSPLDYSKEVARNLKIAKTSVVLDTCMGLGYTAMAAAATSERVITCEASEAVMELAYWNPFCKIFEQKNIQTINADIGSRIKSFDKNSFDVIIHDPPRFTHAPELYSLEFYRELYRVAKRNARLFHYVGSVGKAVKGRKIEKEVAKRLKEAGFKNIRYNKRLQGLFFNR